MPRLLVIETALEGVSGHFHQHAVGAALAARAHRFDTAIFANAHAVGPWPEDGVPIRPWFSRPMASVGTRAERVAAFAVELARLVETEGLTPWDMLGINTTSGRHLDGLLEYFRRRRGAADSPFFHVLLMFDPAQPVMTESPQRTVSRILEDLADSEAWPERCALFAPSPALADAYNAGSRLRVHAVPLAVQTERVMDHRPVPAPPPLVVGLLGEARPEKGYLLLPGLLQSLWERVGRTGRARFIVEAFTAGYEAVVEPATAQLRALPRDFVQLIEQPPTPDVYYRALAETDIVLLPYVGDYRLKVSGVLTEALAGGKPVVVPAGSSLAALLPPGCGETFAGPADLAPTLLRVMDRHEQYRRAALAGAAEQRRLHSHGHVLGLMLAAAAPYVRAPAPRGPI